jgi:hypothetical protein
MNVASLRPAATKPYLVVVRESPEQTVSALRQILKAHEELFDQGRPIRVYRDANNCFAVADLTGTEVQRLAHEQSRPVKVSFGRNGIDYEDVQLPPASAAMYLNWKGGWGLRPFRGFARSPLLLDDGSFRVGNGYDHETSIILDDVPDIRARVPASPTLEDALAAYGRLRHLVRTFPFADAEMIRDSGETVVNKDAPIGKDESAALCAILTAVARPSLPTAPGILISAPMFSGAATGKGLLGRCIGLIAHGIVPPTLTAGPDGSELEKRLASALIESPSIVFLDNVNDLALKSDSLASVLTEARPKIRRLGKSELVEVSSAVTVIITGNGVSLSEDLTRRFVSIQFDAGTEAPESRWFRSDIETVVRNNREAFLADAVTIWRWGRQHPELPEGQPLGSFRKWCTWVRDPLLALGAQDPAVRISELKKKDPKRQQIAEAFDIWWRCHGGGWVHAKDLDLEVQLQLGSSRQAIAALLDGLEGTRVGGYALEVDRPLGRWSRNRYRLK